MISIFNYTDYKKFLGDYYQLQKKTNPHFSYQIFAYKAGFSSKSFLHKIIHGKKNLSRFSILKVAKALKLKPNETTYFEALVSFSDAKSVKDKEHYFNILKELGQSDPTRLVLKNQFEYFSKWYYVAIRELVTLLDFSDNFDLLASSVEPPILPEQAQDAVETLLTLGLLRKLKSGKYLQTERILTADPEIKSLAVQLFQKECLKLASESIERHDRETRDISTLTIGISREGFEQIREEISMFRRRLIKIVKGINTADRVYQLNFQLFPLSKPQNRIMPE